METTDTDVRAETTQLVQTFSLKCKGRDKNKRNVLSEPVAFKVQVSVRGDNALSLSVDCVHNTGGHGQRCKASHPGVDKPKDDVFCPFSIDLPHVMDVASFR